LWGTRKKASSGPNKRVGYTKRRAKRRRGEYLGEGCKDWARATKKNVVNLVKENDNHPLKRLVGRIDRKRPHSLLIDDFLTGTGRCTPRTQRLSEIIKLFGSRVGNLDKEKK